MGRAALVLAGALMLTPGHCSNRLHRSRVGGASSGAPDLCVIFSADVRGHAALLARRATVVDRVRLEVPAVVQVDAGDLFPIGESELVARRARVLLASYARMGVDAMTVGERELAFGPGALSSLARAAGVPIVAANLVDHSGALVFESDRMIEAGKALVGVFGIVDPAPEVSDAWARQWGVTTRDPVAAARTAAASLRARGARLIVELFNGAGGARRAGEIARVAGGVDVVVVGHSAPSGAGGSARRPLVVQAGGDADPMGRIDVRLRSGRPALVARPLTLAPGVPDQLGVGLTLRLDAGPVNRAPPDKRREHWTYASTEACAFCHKPELAQWQTTDHARAFGTLQESGHGLEPACLGCHMTGFLLPGGMQFIDTAVEQMANVGCECCHGPSAAHVASVNKTKGTRRNVDGSVCLGCHTPDQSLEPFDVATAMKKIVGPGHGEPTTP
jgi:Cytochrome c554 and c-prime